jgi:hypothetical protein
MSCMLLYIMQLLYYCHTMVPNRKARLPAVLAPALLQLLLQLAAAPALSAAAVPVPEPAPCAAVPAAAAAAAHV